MVRKSLLVAVLMLAGVVAWVQAQERPLPSILRQPATLPAAVEEPRRLTHELQQAQSRIVDEHPTVGAYPTSQPQPLPTEPLTVEQGPRVPTGPAAVRTVSMAAPQQGDDPEVPAILSGRSGTRPAGPAQPAAQPGALPAGPASGLTPPANAGSPATAPRSLPSQASPSASSGRTALPAATNTAPQQTPAASPGNSGSSANAPAANSIVGPRGGVVNRNEAAAQSIGIAMRGPTLRVDVSGPDSIAVGKGATFEVLVTNAGAIEAANILVAVDFPPHIGIVQAQPTNGEIEQTDGTQTSRIIWTVAQVAAGGQQKLALILSPQQNAPFDLNVEWTMMPLNGTAKVAVTQPALAMKVTGPSEVLFGENANFRFDVSNSGSGAAENVVVRLPEELGGDQKELGTIPSGETRAFVLEIAATEAGEVSIAAIATADGGLSQEAGATFIVRRAHLNITANGPDFKYAGTVANYELLIVNDGDAPATGIIAAAALPAGADYVDGIEGAEKVEGGLRWEIGQLAAGERRSYSIRCIVNQAGQLQFEAGARGDGDVQGADAVATLVEAVADLSLAVEDPKGPKPVGDEVTYTLRIINRGSKAATDVNLICQFSDGIEPTRSGGQPADLVPGQVIFRPIARIDAGQEIVVEVQAKAIREGNHTFRAELTCENPETRRLFEGTTKFFGSARSASTQNAPNAVPNATPGAGPSLSPPSSGIPAAGPSNAPPASAPQLPPSSVPAAPQQGAPAAGPSLPSSGPSLPLAPPATNGGAFRPTLGARPGSTIPR